MSRRGKRSARTDARNNGRSNGKRSNDRNAKPDGTHDPDALTDLQRALLDEAAREVTVRENGRAQRRTLLDVVVKKLIAAAVGGSPHALNQTLRHLGEAQRLERERIAHDQDVGARFKAHQQRKLTDTIAAGHDPISGPHAVLPHPDDVVVTPTGYRFAGPYDADELRDVLHTVSTPVHF